MFAYATTRQTMPEAPPTVGVIETVDGPELVTSDDQPDTMTLDDADRVLVDLGYDRVEDWEPFGDGGWISEVRLRDDPTSYGILTDYVTGAPLRPATADEHARSVAAGETGAFELDGRAVFVAGGQA